MLPMNTSNINSLAPTTPDENLHSHRGNGIAPHLLSSHQKLANNDQYRSPYFPPQSYNFPLQQRHPLESLDNMNTSNSQQSRRVHNNMIIRNDQ